MKRMNLIPAMSQRPDALEKRKGFKILLGITLFFMFLYLWQVSAILRYGFVIASQKKHLKELQLQLTADSNTFDRIKERRDRIDEERKFIAQRLASLKESRKRNVAWSQILEHLSGVVPQNIWLTKISLDEEKVILGGASPDNTSVSDFMTKLDETRVFTNTGFNYIQKGNTEDGESVSFEIVTDIILDKFRIKRP